MDSEDDPLFYKRSKFSSRLPRGFRYTQGHFWLESRERDLWRIGFTRFATRMLGEVVEFDFETKPGDTLDTGQPVGWIEGFKAVTELYSPMPGRFAGHNPELPEVVDRIHASPYDRGWLYEVEGSPPDDVLDVQGYVAFLDETIDRMMGKSA